MRVNIYEINCQYKVTDLRGNLLIRGIGSVVEQWLKNSSVTEVQVTGLEKPITLDELFRLFRVGFPNPVPGKSVRLADKSQVVNGRSVD